MSHTFDQRIKYEKSTGIGMKTDSKTDEQQQPQHWI